MSGKLIPRAGIILLLLGALSMVGMATSNSVPVSGLGTSAYSIGANDLKPPQCASKNLTGIQIVNGIGFGGSGSTLILASSGIDYIFAGDGDDCVLAGAGNDYVNAGDGDDVILAGSGADYVNGGPGYDICYGVFDPGDVTVSCEVKLP